MVKPTEIVWFKRDLRIEDHAALYAAAKTGPVLPLLVFEPDYWRLPDISGRQWAFMQESLEELDAALKQAGQGLVIRTGEITDVLSALQKETGFKRLWSHEETGNDWTYQRDKRVAVWARANGIEWRELPQSGVIRRLKSRNGWAAKWDRLMAQPNLPAPLLQPINGVEPVDDGIESNLGLKPDPCPGRQKGGRIAGLKMLSSFLNERGEPYQKAMSSPAAGAMHCSRLSPHLAWGTLSMREVAQAGWRRQAGVRQSNVPGRWKGAMNSFMGRLHWRDHFMQKLEDEPRLEFENLHRGYDWLRAAEPDPVRLRAYENGETGIPFIDACMRCLTATGWMNFRMRAMLQSFASYHLWLPWQHSGLVMARRFTDYEPGIHWPQVQMQSGTTGINTVRIYNPVKQGQDHDPDGSFTRHWVPELDEVPLAYLQTPWAWNGAASVLGKAYPEPIVDLKTTSQVAKDRVYSIRRSDEFRQAADRIQVKHGSRKSGIKMRGRRKRSTATPGTDQLSLDL